MALHQLVGPFEEPYTRAEAKLAWRVTIDEDDALIDALISASREHAEVACRRQILTATWALTLDRFPTLGDNRSYWPHYSSWGIEMRELRHGSIIEIPRPPLQAVSKVTYLDQERVIQTLDPAWYGVDTAREPGRLYLKQGLWWPATMYEPAVVRIEFVAGWETPADVPKALIVALKLVGAHFYENREASTERPMSLLPLGAQMLLSHYK